MKNRVDENEVIGNLKLSIVGGKSIAKDIDLDSLQCKFEIFKTNGLLVLNGNSLDNSEMYRFSVPMIPRIIRQLLDNKKMIYGHLKTEDVEIFRVDKSNEEFFETMVKQCIEYRCSASADFGNCEILRQLPIRIAIGESDKLIALDKKHAIYPSVRGYYNIKVQDYTNDLLNGYCYHDSNTWD